jgi:hypothetical protein
MCLALELTVVSISAGVVFMGLCLLSFYIAESFAFAGGLSIVCAPSPFCM